MSLIAVRGENLTFSVRDSPPILCGTNIAVGSGHIYGLVGPSGCGKTTLQRCIWGFYKPNSGKISIFGQMPGSLGSGVPGPDLGYMPQEDSLDSILSVEETLSFYQMCFNRKSTCEIDGQHRELLEIIEVDDPRKCVYELSGGQRRRLSFACACIGYPKLLLLDEPTVGSDPLARRNVWMYLDKMCHYNGVTAIITTHYTQEVAKADRMGLMIRGKIIFEGSPKSLQSSHVKNDLEGSILKFMSLKNTESCVESKFIQERQSFESLPDVQYQPNPSQSFSKALQHRVCLIMKKLIWLEVLMTIGWIFLLLFVHMAIGEGLKGYKLAFMNEYNGSDVEIILNQLPSELVKGIEVHSKEEGLELLESNKVAGFIIFDAEAMFKLFSRTTCLLRDQDCDLAGLKIGTYYLDRSDAFASLFMEKLIERSIQNVTRLHGSEIYGNPNSVDFFGLGQGEDSLPKSLKTSSETFVWNFFLYVCVLNTVAILIPFTQDDQRKKRVEKFLSLGFTRFQVISSYPTIIIPIVIIQNCIMVSIGVYLSGLPHGGQYASIGLLIACQTICGVLISLIISLMFADSSKAFLTSVVYTFSACFLGSVIWPHEAMPYFLSNAWYIFPYGRIGKVVTSLAMRELSIASSQSIEVFCVVFLNIAAYFTISLIMIKYKSFS